MRAGGGPRRQLWLVRVQGPNDGAQVSPDDSPSIGSGRGGGGIALCVFVIARRVWEAER